MSQALFRTSVLRRWLWAGMLLVLNACASLPAQEMSDARQAIAAAVEAGAEQKAPTEIQQARSALSQAEVALKGLRYQQAAQLAQQARVQAIAAQQRAAEP